MQSPDWQHLVYALYNRNRYIGGVFLLLLFGESTSVVVGLALNLPSKDFDSGDLITTSSKSFIYFGSVPPLRDRKSLSDCSA